MPEDQGLQGQPGASLSYNVRSCLFFFLSKGKYCISYFLFAAVANCLSKQLGKETLFGFMIAEFLVQGHLVLLLLGLWLGV